MLLTILSDPDATNKLLDTVQRLDNGRRTLSRLSRTCKALSEPALNKLWQELDSFVPLIGLFPSYLLRRVRRPGLGLSKSPEGNDWKRFLLYAERVRRIAYNESFNNVSASIFSVFEQNRPQTYILPNLRHLIWKVETPAGLERSSIFMNPSLEELVLDIGQKMPQLSAFLADTCSRTRLKAFSFSSHRQLPEDFSELLLTQKDLEKIALAAPGALGRDIGRWAASLPALRHLQVDLTGRTPTAVEGFFDDIRPLSGVSTPSSVRSTDSGVFSGDEIDFFEIRKSTLWLTGNLHSKGSFTRLRHVHLTGEVSNVVMFLTHLWSPLTRLDIVIEDPPEKETDWQDLSVLLGERFGDSLQSLRITATGSSRFTELVRSTARTEAPFHPLPLHHLTPMPHLTRLEIDLPESVIFYDSDVSHLASMCPNLEILKLCPVARFTTSPPILTLEGIAPLLSGCARLYTLAVVIDAKQGEEIFTPSFTPSRSLLRLHVGHSWVKDPVQVTVLLSHLAPHLEILKWFNERNRPGFVEANCRGWERVNELLPHVQRVRLMERKRAVTITSPFSHIRPSTSDKSIDATVLGVDQGASAISQTREVGTQSTPHTIDRMMEARPSVSCAAVDARPAKIDVQIDATYSNSPSTQSLPNTTTTNLALMNGHLIRYTQFYFLTPLTLILAFIFRLLVAYPLYIPLRLLHFCLHFLRARREAQSPDPPPTPEERATETITEPEKESVGEGESPTSTHSSDSDYVISPDIKQDSNQDNNGTSSALAVTTSDVEFVPQLGRAAPTTDVPPSTRRSDFWRSAAAYNTDIMSEQKKQERDYTPEVGALLSEVDVLVKAGKLQDGLDKLFTLEKATRNASDPASTTRLVKAIAEYLYAARDYKQLNASITLLSKKHGQLKAAVQALVDLAMGWLDEIKREAGVERWLELVETLRHVTEGKIFLETPRARVTLQLAHYNEIIAAKPTPTSPPRKQCLQTASDLLSDLQVETYSSMERREKTEFILEQMRLLIEVARLKDAEIGGDGKDALGGGEAEWVKVRTGSRKVNEEFLKAEGNKDLKLKFYDLMIQHALRQTAYLDVAKYYHKRWETPSIKEDENGEGKTTLEHIIYYVVLAPHNNEQSDMLHRLFNDPALLRLELHYNLVKCFVTRELMRWPGIEAIYGPFLRTTPVFSSDKRWEDLHMRVIEHNVRVVAQYYTRITLPRLTSLLDLTPQQTEDTLARLVVAGTVWARIDRPAQIVNFRSKRSAEDVMNDWSSDMQKLLSLVEKTWMGMNAAQAAQSRVKAH